MQTTEEKTLEFERMLTMKDVRDVLGVSYGVILGLIRGGELRAYKATGEPVSRERLEHGYGIRIDPADFREFLDSRLIK